MLYVEADMVLSPGAATVLKREAAALSRLGNTVSIVPVYNLKEEDDVRLEHLPASKQGLRQAGMEACAYMSHDFMDYEAWEADVGQAPVKPLTFFVPKEIGKMDHCARSFNRGKAHCSMGRILQEGVDAGWPIEPYFLAPRERIPFYDPAMVYGLMDKIDQIRTLAATGWRFGLNAEAYLVNDKYHRAPRLKLRHRSGRVLHVPNSEDQEDGESDAHVALTTADPTLSYYRWFHHHRWVEYVAASIQVTNLG